MGDETTSDTLEDIIDLVGLQITLEAIVNICRAKGVHYNYARHDLATSKKWDQAGDLIERAKQDTRVG